MAVRIEPMTKDDLPAAHRVLMAAFRDHIRMPMLWPRGDTTDLADYKISRDAAGLDDPTCRMFKAVDDTTGQLVASSEWTIMDAKAAAERKATSEDAEPPMNWPQDGNWPMRRFYTINLEKLVTKYFGRNPYIELHYLSVTPEAQHRGIGSQLLQWGIQEADRLHVPTCLEATPAGLGLYKKYGFREVETIDADMRDFGWKQPYDRAAGIRVFMIRDAA